MDPERLRTFRSVVATGSIQGAADQLRVTSSAVSQQVAALHRETGLTLLERVGRGVRPTAAGMRLAVASGDALRSLARLEALVRDLREGKTGHVTIGHFASAGLAWMPSVVASLRTDFPDVMVELVLSDAPGAPPPSKPDIDVRIAVAGEGVPAGFIRVPLLQDPFVMVVPRGHPEAGRSMAPLGDFRDEQFVANDVVDGPDHLVQARACAAAGFSPRIIVQAADHLSALAFVDRGIGVTMLPVLATADLPRNVRVVALTEPVPHREIYVLLRTAIAGSPVAEHVLAQLRALSA